MTKEELYDEVIRESKIKLGWDMNDHSKDDDIKKVLRAFDEMFYNRNNKDSANE